MIASVVAAASGPIGIGLYLDPTTGQVFVAQGLGLLLGGGVWIAGIVAGLLTGRLVLP